MYVEPLKNKNSDTTLMVFKKIFKRLPSIPKYVFSDLGKGNKSDALLLSIDNNFWSCFVRICQQKITRILQVKKCDLVYDKWKEFYC